MQRKIKTVWLTVNRACQFKCEWCYAHDSKRQEVMDTERALSVIDLMASEGAKKVIFIGGEPLLYKDLGCLIREVKKHNMIASIATNGVLLNDIEYCKTLINAGATNINISLKGIDEEEYIKSVGRTGLKDAILGYRNLASLRFSPTLSYVIVEDDPELYKKIVCLSKEYDLNNWSFQYVKPLVKKDSPAIMSMVDMGRNLCDLYDIMIASGLTFTVEVSFPLCLIPSERRDEILNSGRIYSGCHIRHCSGMIFDTDFRLLPCNHFVDMPYHDEAPTNIESGFIDSFWKSEEVEHFHSKISRYPNEKCSVCSLWDKCGGGCFTRWLFEKPEHYCRGV